MDWGVIIVKLFEPFEPKGCESHFYKIFFADIMVFIFQSLLYVKKNIHLFK